VNSRVTANIRQASSPGDYAAAAALIQEYLDWCRGRYRDDPSIMDAIFGHQSLDQELQALAKVYGPPRGRLLLAFRDGEPCGCVAYRRLSDTVCEMKRMFVPARFHGSGLGRRLCQAIIAEAAADGFSLMRLDTAAAFAEALGLYRSVGFEDCPPYLDYPEPLRRVIVFLQRRLTGG
jgi:GNAT superfamily N-acetyltransferase